MRINNDCRIRVPGRITGYHVGGGCRSRAMSRSIEHAESGYRPRHHGRGGFTAVLNFTLCALVVLTTGGCVRQGELPKGDGEAKYSPPSLQGRITAVDPMQITVGSDTGEMVVVETPADTRFYKLVGGVVLRSELMAGHRVRVWFVQHKPPYMPPRAAVVMLASLDPADDWPK
jgi:hypothetical protein